jgi:MOSC domain-containing protein YiiM
VELLAVNLAVVETLEHNGRQVPTGIYKRPVEGSIRATALGLVGDVQVDRENHGGSDKAIYAYTVENYRYWSTVLGQAPFPFGQFGENFTVTAMPDEAVHLGDVFRIGSILVEVTQPRIPCFKLGIKMGDPAFVKAFLHSGRLGFYLRVLEDGEVRAGDDIVRIREDSERLTIRDSALAQVKGPEQKTMIVRALKVPALSQAWRDDLEKRLLSL